MKRFEIVIPLMMSALVCLSLFAGESGSRITKETPVQCVEQATGLDLAPKVEEIRGGEIDWTRGKVYAVGIGKARPDFRGARAEVMAKRGAYIVAARNAALVLAGIRVGPGGRFENVRNGWIRADVSLKGFRELDATYDPTTRTATARLELPLYGMRGAVTVLGLKRAKSIRRWSWPKATTGGKSFDVIVIDVRGLDCQPSVLPRLATADGQCVFDASEAMTNKNYRNPIARFVTLKRKTVIPTKADHKGKRCLTIKARRVSSDGAIVLDQDNLKTLTSAPNAQNTLKQGRLVIVTDA